MTTNELIERKKELRYTNEEIAKLSGVPLSTVRKIFSGATESPRRSTVNALTKVLYAKPLPPYSEISSFEPEYLREEALAYSVSRQGTYTIYDYYALPEERRAELIDGVIYDMAAPSMVHQVIQMQLLFRLQECAEKHKVPFEVIPCPFDVQLNNDIYTMLQPDILVTQKDLLRHNHHFLGAPEFVVEIISTTSRSRDMFLKLHKYAGAGVREYWVVDPKYQKVLVHRFEDENVTTEYHFKDSIPVGIADGMCEIDFKKIYEHIARFYDKDGKLIQKQDEEEGEAY